MQQHRRKSPQAVRTTWLNHIKCSPLSSAIVQQRVAQRHAMTCLAQRRGAAMRYSFFRTHDTGYYANYQTRGTGMHVLALVFVISSFIVLPSGLLRIFFFVKH